MLYLLVVVDDSKEAVAVELAKDIEEFDGVVAAAIVRNAAEAQDSDTYLATIFTTQLAKSRLEEGES